MTTQELTAREKQEMQTPETTRPGRTYLPDVDIYETQDALWMRADMPGVDEHSLDIRVADSVLTIEGRVALQEYDDLNPEYTEYNVGNYARRFSLSSAIDSSRIKARVTNGVLELELPKAEHAKPRQIPISVA